MENEEIPAIQLDLAGSEYIATPFNAELFTFLGRTVLHTGDVIENSSRNHVFLRTGALDTNEQGQEVQSGTYIFSPETVRILGGAMLNHGFPARLNHRVIPPSDESAYRTYINQQTQEAADYFPEDWT